MAERLLIDANVLGYLLVPEVPANQRSAWLESRRLLSSNRILCVPTPALAEALVIFDEAQRQRVVDAVQARFEVFAFSARMAVCSADLVRPIPNRVGSRANFKVDAMIVATAVCLKIPAIASYDHDIFQIVKRGKFAIDVGAPSHFERQQELDFESPEESDG